MKNLSIKNLFALVFLAFVQTVAMAQDSSVVTSKSTSTSVTSEETFVEPWVWVVGAAVIIIIIVALTRGSSTKSTASGTKDQVTYSKKVTREDV